MDPAARSTLANEVSLSLSDDVIAQFIADARLKMGVVINDAALLTATGKTN